MHRLRLVAALAAALALAGTSTASAASLFGIPLTTEGVRQLTLELAVGVAYAGCQAFPAIQSQDGFRAVVEQGTTKIEVCRITSTTGATSFSNRVEVVRVTGLAPAAVTFYVEGQNFQRETFRSRIEAMLLGSPFVVQ